jgi:hypothetical protein
MLARVTRWEGGDAKAIEESVAQIRSDVEGGPPEGVPAKGFLMLQDPEGGKVIAIGFFENEDDYRQGDETLNSMSPPGEGMGQRVALEKYEVGVQVES